MSKRKLRTVSDQLRDAIRQSGMTVYAVSRDSGVETASLYRFLNGKSLTLRSVDQLCEHLGLELRKKGR